MSRPVKNLLAGEHHAAVRAMMDELIVDCVALDLDLPDMTGFEPIVVYGVKEFTAAKETQLRALSETVIVKDVRSPERPLDETALFLHR